MDGNNEKIGANDAQGASAIMNPPVAEESKILGKYTFECIGPDGKVKWTDDIDNLVTTVGKNYMLETALAASSLTTVGPYMGLISSTSYSAVAAGDTMASHAGWLEAGNANAPTYTAPRKTLSFSAASGGSKATSSAASFAITGTGTVKGAFVVLSTSAVSTIDNTSGTLFSAGLFSGGDKTVANGDTINVSYTATLT
jgi:hypothetical protein